MKYANIRWQSTEIQGGHFSTLNLGDTCQFMAIDRLYEYMGVSSSEIVKISLDEVKTYRGEKLILPFNWTIMDETYMEGDFISMSDDIIPVYISVTKSSARCPMRYFNDHNIEFLKRWAPIGCRDDETQIFLESIGVDSYTNGCMTSTFERRKTNGNKVIIVDAPAGIARYIPVEILSQAEFLSQQAYIEGNDIGNVESVVKKRYDYYKSEAELIITSRLHVASPCMAMGIPVIFVREKIDSRFSWLDKLLPLYDENSWSAIDWHPATVEYEDIKKQMLESAANKLRATYARYDGYELINQFWKTRNSREYCSFDDTVFNGYIEDVKKINEKFSSEEDFLYSIWGCSLAADNFVEEMNKFSPRAKLEKCIDKYKKGTCCGKKIILPDLYEIKSNEILVILAVGAVEDAKELANNKGIPLDRIYYCAQQYMTYNSYSD